MTPVQLEVLIHTFYSPEEHPRNHTTSIVKAYEWLERSGLLKVSHERNVYAVLTDRGKKWIEMILATPMPEQVTMWVDPREIPRGVVKIEASNA